MSIACLTILVILCLFLPKFFQSSSKVLPKFFLLIAMVLISYASVQTQIDTVWEEYVSPPCNVEGVDNDTCWNTSGWVGPMTDTIIAGFATTGCHGSCELVVVYYERFDTLKVECTPLYDSTSREYGLYDYYPYIAGMYWLGDYDCYECDRIDIIKYFLSQFYTDAEQEYPGIINDLSLNYADSSWTYTGGYNHFYYTPRKCLDSLGNECEPGIVACCSNKFEMKSSIGDTNNREVDSIVIRGVTSSPPCPTGCIKDCDSEQRSVESVFGDCTIPCNDGPWTPEVSNVIDISHLADGCSNLDMHIHFSSRDGSPPCPKNYKDVRLDSITYMGPDSCMLKVDHIDLTNFINGWMLTYKAEQNLLIDQCRDEFRVINSICLIDYDTVNNTGLGSCYPFYYEELGCCWAQYTICRTDTNEYSFTKVDGSAVMADTCQQPYAPCVSVCEEMSGLYAPSEDDMYGDHSMENLFNTLHSFERAKSYAIKSEESSRTMEKLFDKDSEIVIYDLFGKKLGSRYDLPYMYSKLHQGVYFIMEKDNDRVVSITKVYIEK
jgi:hypothetical protein